MEISGIVLFHKIYEFNNKHRFTIVDGNGDYITVIFFDDANKFNLVKQVPVGLSIIFKLCKELNKKYGRTSKTFKAYNLEIQENVNNRF